MPLTLVLGPANSAKAGEVLGAYSGAAQRDALLVVPTVADVRHYTRELADQGCVMAAVMTFTGLAEEIARRASYYERRLTRIQRERALERAVKTARLQVLAEAAATKGFPAAAGELAAELERALVSPARFARASSRTCVRSPSASASCPPSTTTTSRGPARRSTISSAACSSRPQRTGSTRARRCGCSNPQASAPRRSSSAPRSRRWCASGW